MVKSHIEIKGKNADIINGLRQGKHIEQIAHELDLTVVAVASRLTYLRKCLNMNTTIQLVATITELTVANQLKSR